MIFNFGLLSVFDFKYRGWWILVNCVGTWVLSVFGEGVGGSSRFRTLNRLRAMNIPVLKNFYR